MDIYSHASVPERGRKDLHDQRSGYEVKWQWRGAWHAWEDTVRSSREHVRDLERVRGSESNFLPSSTQSLCAVHVANSVPPFGGWYVLKTAVGLLARAS